MTFSDRKVARFVNGSFVAAWKNRNPGFHDCDLATERSIVRSPGGGFATKNIVTFLLTPDLKVIHYMTGYYTPSLFLIELEWAYQTYRAGFDASGRMKKDGLRTLREEHRKHQHLHDREPRLYGGGCCPTELGVHSYLGRVHGQLARDLFPLAELENEHLAGNGFAEEDSDATPRNLAAAPDDEPIIADPVAVQGPARLPPGIDPRVRAHLEGGVGPGRRVPADGYVPGTLKR